MRCLVTRRDVYSLGHESVLMHEKNSLSNLISYIVKVLWGSFIKLQVSFDRSRRIIMFSIPASLWLHNIIFCDVMMFTNQALQPESWLMLLYKVCLLPNFNSFTKPAFSISGHNLLCGECSGLSTGFFGLVPGHPPQRFAQVWQTLNSWECMLTCMRRTFYDTFASF